MELTAEQQAVVDIDSGRHLVLLECYGSLLAHRELTLDDVFSERPIVQVSDELQTRIRTCIEDALFSENGDVRLEAFRLLRENFGLYADISLDGSDADWRKLHVFMSEQRKKVLLWILKNNRARLPPGTWRDQIEALLKDFG